MRLGRLIDRCAGHVNRSDNLLALRRSPSASLRPPYPKNTPNTDSLENTVQLNQSPAVAIFRVAELNRTSLQSLESKWKTRGQFPTRE
jgi:hypothetical protein